MFKNSGAKLKAWAVLLAILGILGAFVFAFYYFFILSDGSGALVRLGLVALAVYGLGLWLVLLILYALGDASDNTALILERLEQLERRERAGASRTPLPEGETAAEMTDPAVLKAMLYHNYKQSEPGDDPLS